MTGTRIWRILQVLVTTFLKGNIFQKQEVASCLYLGPISDRESFAVSPRISYLDIKVSNSEMGDRIVSLGGVSVFCRIPALSIGRQTHCGMCIKRRGRKVSFEEDSCYFIYNVLFIVSTWINSLNFHFLFDEFET